MAEEGDGVEDKGLGDTTAVHAETFLEALGHIPESCLFHWWSFSLAKSKTSGLGLRSSARLSQLPAYQMTDKRNLLYFNPKDERGRLQQNNVYLPTKLQNIITQKTSIFTVRRATYLKPQYSLSGEPHISNLNIHCPESHISQTSIFTVRRATYLKPQYSLSGEPHISNLNIHCPESHISQTSIFTVQRATYLKPQYSLSGEPHTSNILNSHYKNIL